MIACLDSGNRRHQGGSVNAASDDDVVAPPAQSSGISLAARQLWRWTPELIWGLSKQEDRKYHGSDCRYTKCHYSTHLVDHDGDKKTEQREAVQARHDSAQQS